MLNNSNAFRPLGQFRFVPSIVDLFENPQNVHKTIRQIGSMKTNIVENDTSFVLTTELPGLNKENISVKFEDDVLTISTQITEEQETKNGDTIVHQERYSSNQSRSFRFDNIDADNINAKYENGVLSLTLAKKAKENSKNININ